MSDSRNTPQIDTNDDVPRMEPWLAVSLLSFVPGIGLFILPSAALVPLYVAMGALMTAGTVMFLHGEMKKRKGK